MGVSKTSEHIQIKIKMPNLSQVKIWNMSVSKTSDHIKVKIKIPNFSQEPPASSKALNEDLKGMDVLCTFKIRIEGQNSYYECIKDQ